MINIPKHKKLILFDGVCNLCNSSVLYVIKRDQKNQFMFAPLQSEAGKHIIEKFNINTNTVDSIILYNPEEDKINYKSRAALKVASQLRVPTNLLSIFLIIPSFISNWVYDFIAKNRYKWYGKKETCMIPTPELQSKFLG
ncbi:DCC1-like thiol-disulfide oxidoreductase family protein [uncultured Algibacter sp.]|uniref:thiol-disulfide oxidoreductase DCC family protein n=1 Tax=uncultured Algibacter sp. TaxID=298659 RepID=UPI00261526D2|nr:DCC1-like thiol-disulfide oxidoreductase family protein [uncultured Algibacter sp.]